MQRIQPQTMTRRGFLGAAAENPLMLSLSNHASFDRLRTSGLKSAVSVALLAAAAVAGGVTLLTACAPAGQPNGPPAASFAPKPEAWDALVAAARQEGTLTVHGATSANVQRVINEDFPRAFPGIKVEGVSSLGAELVPTIMSERAAGRYIPDIMISGSFSMLGQLKPGARSRPCVLLSFCPRSWTSPRGSRTTAWVGG